MTVPSTPRLAGPYIGNGVAVDFSFSFKVFEKSDLVVQLIRSNVPTTLVLDSDYSVSLNSDQDSSPGGVIRYPISGSPMTATDTLTIAGVIELAQTVELPEGGNYRAGDVELGLDRLVIMIQQIASGILPSLRVPELSGVPPLPGAATRAGKQLTFDSAGNPVCVALASGSAAALAADLASTAPGKGASLIAWKASGASAIDVTLDTLLKSMAFTPEMFGGVPDADPVTGSGTDATAAINKAIKAAWDSLQTAAANDFGGVVYISAGNWKVNTDQIVHYPGVTVTGAGMFATNLIITTAATGKVWNLDASTAPYSNVPGYPSTLCNIAIRAASGGAPGAIGVYANKNGCFIHHIWVSGCGSNNYVINNTDVVLDTWISEYSDYALTILQPAVTINDGIVGTGCANGVFVQNQLIMQAVSGGANTIRFPAVTTTPTGLAVTTNNGAFVGWLVTITSGTGAGQQRTVTGYVGSTRTATVNSPWAVQPDATSVFNVDYDNGAVSISNVRIQPCSQIGLDINKARRVRCHNVTMAQTSAAKFLNGAARVIDSVDVSLQGVGGSSALWPGAVNTVADGLTITNSALVDVYGGNWLYWRKGVVQSGGQNITLRLGQVNSNYNKGVELNGGDQILLLEGQISANGSSGGANDAGVESNNTSAGGVHVIGRDVFCSGLGGSQEYGIRAFVQDNGGNTGVTFIEGKARNNGTANISLTGRTDRIRTFGALNGDTIMGMQSATTQIVNYCSSGGVFLGPLLASNLGATVVPGSAFVANTLQQVLSVTGSGEVPALAFVTNNTTARTLRMQVIVDGVTVFDATSSSINVVSCGLVAAGGVVGSGNTNGLLTDEPIRFTSSLVVNVASSLSEAASNASLLYTLHKT